MYSARQLSAVDEYLTESFTTFELMQLCEQVGGSKVSAELPGANQSRASFAFDAVRVLARHGLVDARFFDTLSRARPNRRGDVQRLATMILREPLSDAERETTVWRPAEAQDARRLMWVEALEEALLRREQASGDEEWAEIGRKIDTLARHLRGIPHVGSGSVVAGARLERPIGSGNFGTVWYAHHLESGQPVATKVFNLDRCTDELMLWRFRRSIRALKQLGKHRDVPRAICRAGTESPDSLAFCMPYMPGGNLEKIERRGWSLATKIGVFLEVCRAVAFAHRMGVIHRDIKPANILLDADHHPVLIDFDIADIRFVTELEGEQNGVGTPVFAAPEQLERADAADERSDVYSLGRLLYYFLLERSPGFQREDDPQLDNLRGFAPSLVAIIRRATQSRPDRRYPSVPDLIAAVERYPTGLAALRARLRAGGRWMRAHVAVVSVGLSLLGASMTLNYVQEQRASERARFIEEGRRALDAATDHGARVGESIANIASLAERMAILERQMTAGGQTDARDADELRALLGSMQRELSLLGRDIDAERSLVLQILSFDPSALEPRGEARRSSLETDLSGVASPKPDAEYSTVAPLVRPLPESLPPSVLVDVQASPRKTKKTGRRRVLAEGKECDLALSTLAITIEPKVCSLIKYPTELEASVTIDLDAPGKPKVTRSRDLANIPEVKRIFENLAYPKSCAGMSRDVLLCTSKRG